MNTNSLSKLLTLVAVLLVSMSGFHSWGAEGDDEADPSKQTLEQACGPSSGENYDVNCTKAFPGSDQVKQIGNCKLERYNECKKGYYDDKKEAKKSCDTVGKEWRDKSAKGASACNAFAKTSSEESCAAKIKSCRAKIEGTVGGTDTGDQTMEFLKQAISARLGSSSALAEDAINGGKACVKQYDSKTQKEDEKEFARQKKELDEKVKKEKDKQNEDIEKLREKKDKISTKITELDADNKKEALKRDERSSKEATNNSKAIVDSGRKTKSITSQIFEQNLLLTDVNFKYQTALLELTADKITNRCKQQLMTFKGGLLDPSTAGSDAKTMAGIAAQLGTGAKGTANLNALLKRTKDACFESEALKQKSANMDITKQRSIINNKIADLQDQMTAEKKNLAIEQTALEATKAQIAAEGKNADEEKLKKIADLNSELSNFMDSINQKLKTSQEEQAKTEEEIRTLVLKKNFNVEPAFADANEVIDAAEDARATAYDTCDCDGVGAKTNKLLCSNLKKKALDYDAKKDRAAQKKAR